MPARPTWPQALNPENDATICSRRICIGTSWSTCRPRRFPRAPPSQSCSPRWFCRRQWLCSSGTWCLPS